MTDELMTDDARYFRAIAGDERAVVAAGFERSHRPTPRQQHAVNDSASAYDEETYEITRTVAGETYRLGAESFFQTNVDLLPQLIEEAIGEQARPDCDRTLLWCWPFHGSPRREDSRT